MNRVVDVYSLNLTCRAVVGAHPPDRIRVIEVAHSMDGRRLHLVGCSQASAAHIQECEVHRICYGADERYVAMEPGLRQILEAPFESAMTETRRQCEHQVEMANQAANVATARTRQMMAMPWWRRAIFAMRIRNIMPPKTHTF